MVFSSAVFLFIFMPVTIIGYYFICKKTELRNAFLLLLSILFYTWGEPVFVFLLLLCVLINWFAAEQIRKSGRYRTILFVMILGLDVFGLLVFKYTDFVINNLNMILRLSIPLPGIHLPLGISFFTFQVISYQIDEYRSGSGRKVRLTDFMLYALMFPQLVAGPIVRFADVINELRNRIISMDGYSEGLFRFTKGLSKKLILADHLAVIADNAYYLLDQGNRSAMLAWIGSVAYTLQIYFDFSGYSDMAIGMGKMFGFTFPENFDYPYTATSITDFWRKWHMTLSQWFRDYIYIPLGGNRSGNRKTIRNLLIVWGLTGFWHGAGWNFIVWGLGYFVLLIAERYIIKGTKKNTVAGRVYTLFFVNLLWVVFRSSDLSSAVFYLGRMFGSGGTLYDAETLSLIKNAGFVPALAVLCCFPWWRFVCKKTAIPGNVRKSVGAVVAVVLFIVCMGMCVTETYSPFIYFNF